MKELKFKAISKDTEKWIYGYGVVYYKLENIALIINHTGNNLLQHNEVYPETICQFTGVKDKDNVEVYDGDIFEDEKGSYYLIWATEGGFAFTVKAFGIKSKWPYEELSNEQNLSWFRSNCRVIGNKINNALLLK